MSSNHKLSINQKICPDTNLHKTKHTQTSNTQKKFKIVARSEDVERTRSDTWIGWQLVMLVLWAQSTKNGPSDSNIFFKGGGQIQPFKPSYWQHLLRKQKNESWKTDAQCFSSGQDHWFYWYVNCSVLYCRCIKAPIHCQTRSDHPFSCCGVTTHVSVQKARVIALTVLEHIIFFNWCHFLTSLYWI